MSPIFAINNPLYGLGCYTIATCYRPCSESDDSATVNGPNGDYIGITKFVAWVTNTTRRFWDYGFRMLCAFRLPPLAYLVRHIVGVCSQEQMKVIATNSIVALVKYVKAIGDWSAHKSVSNSVGVIRFSISAKRSIPAPEFSASPLPALVKCEVSGNLCPKPLNLIVCQVHSAEVNNMHVHVNNESEASLIAIASE